MKSTSAELSEAYSLYEKCLNSMYSLQIAARYISLAIRKVLGNYLRTKYGVDLTGKPIYEIINRAITLEVPSSKRLSRLASTINSWECSHTTLYVRQEDVKRACSIFLALYRDCRNMHKRSPVSIDSYLEQIVKWTNTTRLSNVLSIVLINSGVSIHEVCTTQKVDGVVLRSWINETIDMPIEWLAVFLRYIDVKYGSYITLCELIDRHLQDFQTVLFEEGRVYTKDDVDYLCVKVVLPNGNTQAVLISNYEKENNNIKVDLNKGLKVVTNAQYHSYIPGDRLDAVYIK